MSIDSTIKKMVKKGKFAYLFVGRILLAKDHFEGIGLITKLKMNFGGGFLADQYALYDFAHNDKHEYLSEFDWYRSRVINDPFEDMCNNKVIFEKVASPLVRVPRNVFMMNKGRMVSLEPSKANGWKTADDALELIREHGLLYKKPLDKGKGDGVARLEYADGAYLVDGSVTTAEDLTTLLNTSGNWFLCEGVQQSAFEDSLYDKTTNTIRLITLRDPQSGDYRIFFAVQRIGTHATIPVDNGSKGGLTACIDLETGELSEARSLQAHGSHEVHPDTGNPIKGVRIPDWDSLKEQILQLAHQFPFMNFIAWDILLVDDGFCIIEANTSSGVNIIQLWGGQRNGYLGDFYRFHGVIK